MPSADTYRVAARSMRTRADELHQRADVVDSLDQDVLAAGNDGPYLTPLFQSFGHAAHSMRTTARQFGHAADECDRRATLVDAYLDELDAWWRRRLDLGADVAGPAPAWWRRWSYR